MSLSKSKCLHLNNCLQFLKRVVPLANHFDETYVAISNVYTNPQYLTGENLKAVWGEFSTLS